MQKSIYPVNNEANKLIGSNPVEMGINLHTSSLRFEPL